MVGPGQADGLALPELVASLALATDLAMAHPMEQGLGACILATRTAELLGLDAEQRGRVFYLALLRHIGCTTESQALAGLVGDEVALGGRLAPLSGAKGSQFMAAILGFATAGKPPVAKARTVGRMAAGLRQFTAANTAICEVAQTLAGRLVPDPDLVAEIATVYERWDGKGFPAGLKRDSIPLTVRITQVADLAAVLHDLEHPDLVEVVVGRSGSGFDPLVVEAFTAHATELLASIDVTSRWDAVMSLAPPTAGVLTGERLDQALHAVADFADLKSPYLVGHSSGVAGLAARAAECLRLPADVVTDVRRAALLHDLGRIGVSAGIWGKPGPLTSGEWEAVRLHPYHTDRVLGRAPFLARLAAIASLHHERLDGSGYFRGCPASQQPAAARVLAAADGYHAMREPRAHRPALDGDQAAAELHRDVRRGWLDRDTVDAVLEAAGHRVGRRKEHAGGLTAREVEVLRLVARGMSTREIAQALTIAPKTAGNHIQSIYDKTGVTTRAAATVFAMQHGLADVLSG
jgi:HD-GYP domain-containing protein (c-di-GMP phosphodiesterase class II)